MKPKSNSVVMVQQNDNGTIVVQVLGTEPMTFDPAKADKANRAHAEFHGWKQRLADAAAMSRDDETGKPATPEEKRENIAALIEHYESGSAEWSRVGQGGGGKSITIEAICRLQGKDYATVEADVEAYAATGKDAKGNAFGGDTKKALAYLRLGTRVAEMIDTIRKERAPAPKIDADKALGELGAK